MPWWMLLALVTLQRTAEVQAGRPDEEAALLLKARNSWTNWQAALANPNCGTPGTPWSAGFGPCGVPGNGSSVWRGISCDDAGHVTALQLSSCSLEGTLPAELAQLASLATLDLSHNSLSGGVPNEWTVAGALPALATLQLAFNNLTGALDDFTPAIQGFVASLVFNVSRNAFSEGSIPGEWYSRTLQLIDIAYNGISGPLPVDWGRPIAGHAGPFPSHFPSLARLAIEGNNITGPNDPWPGGGTAVFSPNFVCTGRPGNPDMEIVTRAPSGSASSGSGGLSGGAIAGIVVGCVAAAALLGLAAFLLLRRRRGAGAPAIAAGRQGGDAEKGLGGGAASLRDSAHEEHGRSGSQTLASLCGAPPSAWSAPRTWSPSDSLQLDTDPSNLPSEWNIVEWSELEVSRTLGSGSFGTVVLAKFCHTPVAVKLLGRDKAPGASDSLHRRRVARDLAKEVAIMSKLRSPNVCLYMGACLDPPCLIMEHCARQSLDTLLAHGLRSPQLARQLRWPRLLSFALGAARGMAYLHSRQPPVFHRDLKAANLLVTSSWQIKVCDFNISRLLADDGDSLSTAGIQNPRWLAPEVLGGQAGGLPADVWAFGTVMHELMTWRVPFEGVNPYQIINRVLDAASGSGLEVPPPGCLPGGTFTQYQAYVELMQACWARDPAHRPTFAEVVGRVLDIARAESKLNGSSSTLFSSQPASMEPSPHPTAVSPSQGSAHDCSAASMPPAVHSASDRAAASHQADTEASHREPTPAGREPRGAAAGQSQHELATQAASQAYAGALLAHPDLQLPGSSSTQ